MNQAIALINMRKIQKNISEEDFIAAFTMCLLSTKIPSRTMSSMYTEHQIASFRETITNLEKRILNDVISTVPDIIESITT